MGVMAVGLFITILLLFHQISSSIQESVQVDLFTSSNDRDEIPSGDRSTLNSKEDCPDTVCLRSCQSKLNGTRQELVEARGKISGLEREIRTQNREARDGKAKIGELEGKINALQSENSDLETQISRTMTLILDLNGWSYLAKSSSWYKAFDQRMTFDQAVAYCASRKSHLVSIHSHEENDFVWELAKTVQAFHGFWIGLKRNPNKGNALEWTDGSSVDFTNWYGEEPDLNTHTWLLSYNGKWGVYPPTQQILLICKRSSQF
ncbi:unnamed protein product, partial [Mesorhabditis belari]|uniref:C-type lectin domain-containing protein n=1 Tax=Mesorhabditis belari TaxID=2138241 RepID=A0AAF3ERH2_9BILA